VAPKIHLSNKFLAKMRVTLTTCTKLKTIFLHHQAQKGYLGSKGTKVWELLTTRIEGRLFTQTKLKSEGMVFNLKLTTVVLSQTCLKFQALISI